MTPAQATKLQYSIDQLHSAMRWDFVLTIGLMGLFTVMIILNLRWRR